MSIVTSIFGSDSQDDAYESAEDVQWNMFDRIEEWLDPWRKSGKRALEQWEQELINMPEFRESPGYQWRMDQGIEALDRSAAARGKSLSGKHREDLIDYGQGAASQEYDSWYNRWLNRLGALQRLSATGQNAAGTISNFGYNTARDVAGHRIGSGQAEAGMWNTIGSSLDDLAFLGAQEMAAGSGGSGSRLGSAPANLAQPLTVDNVLDQPVGLRTGLESPDSEIARMYGQRMGGSRESGYTGSAQRKKNDDWFHKKVSLR